MTLMEPSDKVILMGHNCRIEIGQGNAISKMVISGHNNKVFTKIGGPNSQLGVIEQLEVSGHNNRIEGIISNLI